MATTADLVARLGGSVNDPKLVRSLDIAMSWARTTLGRVDTDDLSDLGPSNLEALLGYAGDIMALPRAKFGYFEPAAVADVEAVVAVGDIGRRWRPMLLLGMVRNPGSVGGFA